MDRPCHKSRIRTNRLYDKYDITLVQSKSVRCSRVGPLPPLYWSMRTLVRTGLYLARMAEHVFSWVGGENL